MSVRRVAVAAACSLFALCAVPAAHSQGGLRSFALPTPSEPLSGRPPFPSTSRFTVANVFHPPIQSTERVVAGLDERGTVTSIRVLQRLRLSALGDYLLSVPGPIVDVAPGPGSQSQPGLRRGAVVWQGFSAGGKILAAWATLEAERARGPLPLRIDVDREAGRVRIANATAVRVTTATGEGDQFELARILDELRRHPSGKTLGSSVFANISGRVVRRPVEVSAALRIRGAVSAGPVRRRIEAVLGGDRPLDLVVRFPPGTRPRVALRAEPFMPAEALRPPVGSSWTAAVRRRPRVLTGRRVLDLTWKLLAETARVHQYQSYLANPDPNGGVRASYSFRTVAQAARPQRAPGGTSSGLGPLAIALIAAGAVVTAGGLVVLWAHS